jgi:hypothetical protein
MTIDLDRHGFVLDSAWCYIALSWPFIITAAVVSTVVWYYRRWKAEKQWMDMVLDATQE